MDGADRYPLCLPMPVVWVLLKYKLCLGTAGLPGPSPYFRALHCVFDLLKNLFRGNFKVETSDSRLRKVSGEPASSLSSALFMENAERLVCFVEVYITP